MIDGVQVVELKVKPDERGRLVELFRADQGGIPFGQVHLTTVFPGGIKAWHRHKRRTDVLAVVEGQVRLGLYDGRTDSRTEGELNQFFLGVHGPLRITIPPGVWFGLKGMGTTEALVVVFTDHPHDPRDPDEERMDPVLNEIPFDWERRDG